MTKSILRSVIGITTWNPFASGWSKSLRKAERIVVGIAKDLSYDGAGIGSARTLISRFVLNRRSSSFLSERIFSEKLFYTPQLLRVGRNLSSVSDEGTEKMSDNVMSILAPSIKGASNSLSFISDNAKRLVETDHPLLSTVSSYYLNAEGKKLRPLLVLLVSKMNTDGISVGINESQQKLAFITEMIHTASLLHDDVIDDSPVRRGLPSANRVFGNKMSILGGDFLLSRASVALARLGNLHVVQLLAEVIGDLVEGEVQQLRGSLSSSRYEMEDLEDTSVSDPVGWDETVELLYSVTGDSDIASRRAEVSRFADYLNKTYLKTASLMAKSCQAAILLDSSPDHAKSLAAYQFGRCAGIAFQVFPFSTNPTWILCYSQLIDDYLDIVGSSKQIGKPAASDLRSGVITSPVLFASFEDSKLNSVLHALKCETNAESREKRIEEAMELTLQSRGIERTKMLAELYVERAVDNLQRFPTSDAREALVSIAKNIVHRKK